MNRYDVGPQLNSGSFGSVFLALDKTTQSKVAIKKVPKKFYDFSSHLKNREVKALRELEHENIIVMQDFQVKGASMYFVFELMDYNLYEVMANRRNVPFPFNLVQFILHQILSGLGYLHTKGYFHRDIKPENILISGSSVKIADFGLVQHLSPRSKRLSQYVSTSWYRAPEVFLGYRSYSSPIDVWAVGCIAYELMTLTPLFPSQNECDQIYHMCDVLGSPTQTTSLGGYWKLGSQLASVAGVRFPIVDTPTLPSTLSSYPSYNPTCLQFVASLLQFDPTLRPKAIEALDHRFFDGLSYNLPTTIALKKVGGSPIPSSSTPQPDISLPSLSLSPRLSTLSRHFIYGDEDTDTSSNDSKLSDSDHTIEDRHSPCSLSPDSIPPSPSQSLFSRLAQPLTDSSPSLNTLPLSSTPIPHSAPLTPRRLKKQPSTHFHSKPRTRRLSLIDTLDIPQLTSLPISISCTEPHTDFEDDIDIFGNDGRLLSDDEEIEHIKKGTALRRMSNLSSQEFRNVKCLSKSYDTTTSLSPPPTIPDLTSKHMNSVYATDPAIRSKFMVSGIRSKNLSPSLPITPHHQVQFELPLGNTATSMSFPYIKPVSTTQPNPKPGLYLSQSNPDPQHSNNLSISKHPTQPQNTKRHTSFTFFSPIRTLFSKPSFGHD